MWAIPLTDEEINLLGGAIEQAQGMYVEAAEGLDSVNFEEAEECRRRHNVLQDVLDKLEDPGRIERAQQTTSS